MFDFASDNTLRLCVFIGMLGMMVTLEWWFPRRKRVMSRGRRWLTNSAIVAIDSLALRFLVPVMAVGIAGVAAQNGWGLLAYINLPLWVELLVAIVVLDMLIYWQHVASHKLPILWRVHRVHHVDRDLDASTGIRFHPIEIVLSMFFKMACVLLLGASALAVFLFEILLNASALFNHANLRLPSAVDRILRQIIVTPDMHRVHHSTEKKETDSNYGFFLSVWDRLFRTYIAQPKLGHQDMRIGLVEYQSEQPACFVWSLKLPFKSY